MFVLNFGVFDTNALQEKHKILNKSQHKQQSTENNSAFYS
ncbi:hypothetical protein HMPREF1580_01369 [Gardnerella vaginalis JCP8070]|nr:hypothetical protein HMPREF1580_01369 [Gardnerella vaginalis JCP8070]